MYAIAQIVYEINYYLNQGNKLLLFRCKHKNEIN